MRLKVVTYNIKSGLYHPDGLEAVARVLEDLSPDVVALQEVDRHTRRSRQLDQAAWLADRLEYPHHCFGPATPWQGGGEYGVALVSSYPLDSPRVEHLWVPSGEGVTAGEREPRVALSAAIAGMRVIVTHLGLNEDQRVRQARQLLELVTGAEQAPGVIAGDLNGTPESPEIRLLAEGLHDVLQHLPQGERITFPSGDPQMHGDDFLTRTLDYIFVTDGVVVEAARVVPEHSLASDHNPCEAILELSEEQPSPQRPDLGQA